MAAKKIKTKPDKLHLSVEGKLTIGGWIDGKYSYLWIGNGDKCMGTISCPKLYRLAKAIVKSYESAREKK